MFYAQISTEEKPYVESGSSGHLSNVKKKLNPKREFGVSQTSVETLIRLFPNTKLSVLHLVLQRCDQDLLKAIEYFACTERCTNIGPAGLSEASAFRPPEIERFPQAVPSGFTDSSKVGISCEIVYILY